MNIIEKFKLGATKVTICDDYIERDPEKRKEIIQNFKRAGIEMMTSKKDEKNEERK